MYFLFEVSKLLTHFFSTSMTIIEKKHTDLISHYYNAKLVLREHSFLCTLKNPNAFVEYTKLYHKKYNNDLTIEFTGFKSGEQSVCDEFSFRYTTKRVYQPSHVQIELSVNKTLLLDPVQNYPCQKENYGLRDDFVRFCIVDFDAFRTIFSKISGDHDVLTSFVCTLMTDWNGIDFRAKKTASSTIQKAALQQIFSPEKTFYLKQAETLQYFCESNP